MDFALTNEQRMILATVREFVTRELLPLEPEAQRAERQGRSFPEPADVRRLEQKAKTAGLWGLLTPEEYGGANLGMLMTALISAETSKALIPFTYGGYADNILYECNAEQKQRYLLPTIEGDRSSCFALTEPDTGSDATNIQMPAVREGSDWILNGRKVFITNGLEADFAIVFAVTDKSKGHQGGVTAFLVDRAMGWSSQPIQTMGAWRPAEISFDGVRVPEENVLGEVGKGFQLAMSWIGQGRIIIPARAIGQAQRLLEMALDYSRQRIAFGRPIAEYQAIQWMLADSAVEIEQVKWLVLNGATALGNKPALIDGPTGRTLSYADLARSVRRAAANLARRGFRKGDVFAIYSPNVLEYAVALHAVATLGGIASTANPLSTPRELALQLNDAQAKYLVTIPELLDHALEAARQTSVKEIFVFGEAAGASPFADLLQGSHAVPAVAIDPRTDLVALPYSSGTTGLPKGVMLTHRNLVANILQTSAVIQAPEGERSIAVLPFYHIYGFTVLLNISLYQGVTIVTMPRFDLELFLKLLQDYGITRANVVPPIVLALAKHPLVARYDLHALQSINSGAAPLDASVEQACGDRLKCFVAQGYGLTETSPVVSTTPVDPARRRGGSAGLLIPNTECKVMDPASGAELGPGELGEGWIRGPQVMTGYLKQPEATAAMLDEDGWLRTGDIGSVDIDGYLHVVDRLKELIKYKGYQVAPAELEGLLLTHPAVADAAVIPCPDPEAGEVPKT